jgi:sugar phosphate isomerase/epimerase
MRLGGFFDEKFSSPAEWVAILQSKGYRAAYSPYRVPPGGQFPAKADVLAYAQAAQDADILIAEVGAWGRNYVSEDEAECQRAIEESIRLLEMAEKLGACCLVNSAGWRQNPAENFSEVVFRRIIETAQTILDAVRPVRTSFTLELVPDIFPYSCDSYLDLLRAVDRPGFGVHLDLANITVSPYLCYHNAELIQECVDKLGLHIKSCHAKDVIVSKGMVVHINETRPGLGCLDYPALIRALNRLNPNLPLMMEHLSSNDEYRLAAEYIRSYSVENL